MYIASEWRFLDLWCFINVLIIIITCISLMKKIHKTNMQILMATFSAALWYRKSYFSYCIIAVYCEVPQTIMDLALYEKNIL